MNRPSAKVLPAGKLPVKLLDRFLKRYTNADKRVVIGPSVGLDCAVIDFAPRSNGFLLLKTDPITFVAEDIGTYAVNINANDIAVMGGVPRWFLATLLMPEGSATEKGAERIFSGLSRVCRGLGISFCGGHTEVTYGLDRPVLVGCMAGEVKKNRLVSSAGARVGDDIILTKGIALEAASIIAREKKEELKGVFPAGLMERCRGFIKRPGISIVKDAGTALKSGRVHAMHDPTEGGLSMGLFELALASGVGMVVEKDKVIFIPESLKLLEYFGLDPMGAIASGALLLTVHPDDTGKITRALGKVGIKSGRIGTVTGKSRGVRIIEDGKTKTLKVYQRDEITKIF
ncbi:MAG: hydrogenase expression/formation protein [Deltaproteobacteria bacterium]|nr:hydrogenase expression/formation protein [Deltaproteobacteria bacterium]